MILWYCRNCEHHEAVVVNDHEHSRCLKENCLSIYTKCLTQQAVREFIDKGKEQPERPKSALDLCYPLF